MKDWSSLCVDLLPAVLQDFVQHIGLVCTMLLVERYGGIRLYVPHNPDKEHVLAQIIGLDNLLKLSRIYGGEGHFTIPKAQRALRAIRDAKIRSEYGPRSTSFLAREYRLTERQIWTIVGRRSQPNPNQNKLFL